MKKYIVLGSAALILAGAVAATQSAWAYRGDPSKQGPNYSPERHEAMQKAFDGNDYNAWKELMGNRGRVTQVVNEQNFSRFSEMRRLMLEGKTDEAGKIRAELGLGQGNRGADGANRGQNRNGNFIDKDRDGVCDRLQ